MKKLFKTIGKLLFPTLIMVTALAISASAATFSVIGLSKLFAGAAMAVIIMAGTLEASKLVVASLLHRYWKSLSVLLKLYLTLAVLVLIGITSIGIYGYLSSAYQETATMSGIVDKEVEVLELRKNRFVESRDYYMSEKEALDNSISDLREGLVNNVRQYVDENTGQIVTTSGSSSNRRALQAELDQAVSQRDTISIKLEGVTDSINAIDLEILDVVSTAETASELGPLKYISKIVGWEMDRTVNVLILIIVFVFDPLAICLIIAANFAFSKAFPRKEEEVKKYKVLGEENVEELEADPNDLPDIGETDEERMDIIGQNGNTGIHYDNEDDVISKLYSDMSEFESPYEYELSDYTQTETEEELEEAREMIDDSRKERIIKELEEQKRNIAMSDVSQRARNQAIQQIDNEIKKLRDEDNTITY